MICSLRPEILCSFSAPAGALLPACEETVGGWAAPPRRAWEQLAAALSPPLPRREAEDRAFACIQSFIEVFEERAAIMEYDGELPRHEAERAAWERVFGPAWPRCGNVGSA